MFIGVKRVFKGQLVISKRINISLSVKERSSSGSRLLVTSSSPLIPFRNRTVYPLIWRIWSRVEQQKVSVEKCPIVSKWSRCNYCDNWRKYKIVPSSLVNCLFDGRTFSFYHIAVNIPVGCVPFLLCNSWVDQTWELNSGLIVTRKKTKYTLYNI